MVAMKEWVLDVARAGRRGFIVCLREVVVQDDGLRIMTGVRTAPLAFDIMMSDYQGMAERLARSVHVLTAETLTKRDEEELAVAGELAERLGPVLGGDSSG